MIMITNSDLSLKQIQGIILIIANELEVDINEVYSKSRKRETVMVRQVFWYIMRKHTGITTTQLGAILRKDHATVLNGIKSVKDHLDTEVNYRNHVEKIEARITKIIKENRSIGSIGPDDLDNIVKDSISLSEELKSLIDREPSIDTFRKKRLNEITSKIIGQMKHINADSLVANF